VGIVETDGRPSQWAASLIRKKARLLIGSYGFSTSDREDIEQELWYHLLKRQGAYDPSRGKISTFIARILDNRIRTMIEHRRAVKRSCDLPVESLDQRVSPEIDLDRHEVVDRDTYLRVTGQISRSLGELQDLSLDVARVLSSLSPDLCEIALLLMRYTITEVSRCTGIPRTTINDKRKRIREIFHKAGLDDYLKKVPSHSDHFR